MKKTLTLTIALVASTLSVRATNISLADFSGTTLSNPVTFADGSSLPTGGAMVRIGYFNTAAQTGTWLADLRSNNIAQINSALQSFIPLGENAAAPNLGDIPTAATGPRIQARTINGVSQPGRLAGQITTITPVAGTANTANAGGVPNGSRIYLLVYSDTNSTLTQSEQFGVFSSDVWLMPSDGGSNLQLNTTDIDSAAEVFRGTFGSLRLAPIPEPTSGALALVVGLGMLSRRRR